MLGISRFKPKLPSFHNLKNRLKPKLTFKTWLFFVTSFFIIGIGIYVLQQTMGAKAAWFDEGYSYRQRLPITNGGSAQTDLQVGITMNTSTLITANKMQSDCDDIRIVTQDGQLIPHWIQEQTDDCNETDTKIWIKLASVPTTDMNIYIYYGNASATNVEDPEETFLFFEDFSNTTLDSGKWGTRTHTSGTGASYSIASGTINFTTTTVGGYYWLYSTEPIAQPYWIETNVRNNYATSGNVVRVGSTKAITVATSGNLYPGYAMDDGGNSTLRIVGDTTAGGFAVTSVANATTSGIWRFGWLATSSQQGFLNGTSVMTGTNNTNPIGNSYLYLGAPSNATTGTVSLDWVFARKYVATMPTLGAFGSEETSPDAVAYWKFDEGAGTTAGDAVTGKTGTLTNGPTWQTQEQCVINNCIQFDGTNDYFDTGKDYSWSTSEPFSFSFWIRPTGATGNQTVFGKGLTDSYEYSFKIVNLAPSFTYWNTSGSGELQLTSSVNFTLNKWHHVIITYDSSTAYMYIDGVQVATDTVVGNTLHDRTNNLTIGRGYYNSGAGASFPGFIDEFKIYNSARSGNEAQQEFAQGYQGASGKAIFGATDQAFINNGLVGYWKMDESTWVGNNAVLDSSGNLFSGTAVGNAGITAPGKFGNGGTFDGNGDYITTGSDPTLNPDNMTVSAWVKPSSGYTSDYRVFASRGTGDASTSRDWQFRAQTSTGYPQIYFYSTSGSQLTATGTAALSTTSWTHLVGIYDGASVKLYVNGILVDSNAGTLTRNMTATGQTTIGQQAGSGLYYWLGQLDDIRIYNRAFTDKEVTQLSEWAPPPVAYWDMNENIGTSVKDMSGIGYTGTFGPSGSAPTWLGGQYGSGLRFDGTDDYVNFGDVEAADFGTGDFTLSGWINTTTTSARYFLSKRSSCGASNFWNLYTATTGNLQMEVSEVASVNYNYVNPITVINDGMWHHFTFIRTGATITVYVDGKLDTVDVGPGVANLSNTNNLQFAENPCTGPGSAFPGGLDDVKIYNYARTHKQVAQDMNAGHPSVGSPIASPVGYWKLDEGYGSVINNTGSAGIGITGVFGTGTSAPTWSNSGKFGKALSFDGTSDHIIIGDNIATDLSTGFAVSLWANPSKYDGNTQVQGLMFSKGTYPDYNYRITTVGTGGARLFEVGANIGGSFQTVSTTRNLNTDQWYHVVGSYNGNELSLYVDGKLENNLEVNGTVVNNATAIYIGKYSASTGWEYKGLLDEIKLYGYGLTADEVKVEYNRSKSAVLGSETTGVGGTTPANSGLRQYCVPGDTSTCNAPVAEWLMNENTGTTVYDTGSTRNGTFGSGGSAPTWGVGFAGSGVRFDGTQDVVDTSAEISLSSSTSFTVNAWVNLYNLNFQRYALDRTTASNELISLYSTGPSLGIQIRGDNGAGLTSTTVPSVFTEGQWAFISINRNVTTDTINTYVNGVLKSTITDSTSGTISPTFRIGNHSGAASGWSGIVDQLRIYDYTRSQAQIMWEYNKGSPLFRYKFDECEGNTLYNSAQTFNDTAAGSNGTLTIGATGTQTTVGTCETSGAWYNGETGKRGASMNFDGGDDSVDMGDISVLDSADQLSFCAWVNHTSTNTDDYIFGKYSSGTDTGIQLLRDDVGSASGRTDIYKIRTPQAGTNDPTIESRTNSALSGSWNHVCFTFIEGNASGLRLYINGIEDPNSPVETTQVTSLDSGSETAEIGSLNGSGYFDGKIDDVQIYNYVLTSSQIKTIYNNGAVSFE